MKTTFTQEYILKNSGCYEKEEAQALSFMKKKRISIKDILRSEIPTKDKTWFVFMKCELGIREKQDLCIRLAEIVLVIYENKYPDDKRVRKCIEASKQYLAGKITRKELSTAAYAAYAANYSAAIAAIAANYAANYSAAIAAIAANYAAIAANYAAIAANYAAIAADSAADSIDTALIDCMVDFMTT
jgi:hypothetical protein